MGEDLNFFRRVVDDYLETMHNYFETHQISCEEDMRPFLTQLKTCYQECRVLGEEYWNKVLAVYPYDNVMLHDFFTRVYRDSWQGRALLFSVFCKKLIISHDNKFYYHDQECEFLNDTWIGSLYAEESGKLMFVNSPAVVECYEDFIDEVADDYNCELAASALQELYTFCSQQKDPVSAWDKVMAIYSGVAPSVESLLIPYLSPNDDEPTNMPITLSTLTRYYHAPMGDTESGKEVCTNYAEFFGKTHTLLAKFFDAMSVYIIRSKSIN